MSQIEIRPEQLRTVAESLRASANRIQTQVDQTSQIVNQSAVQEILRGNLGDALWGRFRQQEGIMDEWGTVLRNFAAKLETAAEAFEMADRDGAASQLGEAAVQADKGQPVNNPKPEQIYEVVKGDTLWAIAKRYGTTVDALVEANNIPNRDLIYPGQEIIIPGDATVQQPTVKDPAPPSNIGDAPRTSQDLANRINSYNVESNPRYVKGRDGNPNTNDTYCNLFVHDVAKGMGAEIPLYVTDGQGTITKWLGATYMKDWLDGKLSVPGSYSQGPESGWMKVDHATAAAAANEGHVAVAAGHGHMAMVRPGTPAGAGKGDVMIAQAGARNFNNGSLSNGWGQWTNEAEFYIFKP